MYKQSIVVAIVLSAIVAFTGCGGTSSQSSTSAQSAEGITTSSGEAVEYEQIYNEYSKKLEDEAEALVEDLRTKAAEVTTITELASLSTEETTKLADISTEGLTKMAEIGTGEDYNSWSKKLTDVYTEQAEKITDAYTELAGNSNFSAANATSSSVKNPANSDDTVKEESSSTSETKMQETHLYDRAEVVDVLSGGGEVIGQSSVITAKSTDCTIEALTDWYFNYVEKNDFNWCVIVYSDIPGKGVYSSSGYIEVNIGLEQDENDKSYMTGDDSESTMYIPEDDGTLRKF